MQEKYSNSRRTELDILRIISMFVVILLHVIGTVFYRIDVKSEYWIKLNILNSATRWCVPAFVMISGSLFLDMKKEVEYSVLYKKYIFRILISFIFWSFMYTIYDILKQPRELGLIQKFADFLICVFLKPHYHLWFVYMILGLYILIPVIRAIVRMADEYLLKYWLFLMFLVGFILNFVCSFEKIEFYLADSISYLNLGFLSGFVFYFVMGYYLSNYPPRHKKVIYSLGVLSYVITTVGTYCLSMQRDVAKTIYDYLYPNTAFIAIAVFVAFLQLRKIEYSDRTVQRLKKLSDMMFGVYFIHVFVIYIFEYIGITIIKYQSIWCVLFISIMVFGISCGIIGIMSKLKWFRNYCM